MQIRLFSLAAAALALFSLAAARGDELADARTKLYADYAARLEELAHWCDDENLPRASETLRGWLPRRSSYTLTLFVLPRSSESATEPAVESSWQSRWQPLRVAQADALFALAKRAAAEGRSSLAYELATETVRENPDHAAARQLLGYVKSRGAWRTPFEVKQLSAGKVWTDRFGWLPAGHVERYEKGERNYRNRWVSTAEDAALHSEIGQGWKVETDHYVVTTNHSLEEGVKLAKQLEVFYAVWMQAFAGYQMGTSELDRRFAGKSVPRRDTKPHEVIYFRSRAEYNNALRSYQPQIDITLGIYFAKPRTAYFFAGDDQHAGTIYHEAAHQLFQETRTTVAEPGKTNNFWIVEAIACYMESLDVREGYCTLGGPNAGRVPAARGRLLEDNFYVPLAELVRLGMEDLQRHPQIKPLYSQSAGLADFFMHAGNGKYREPLVRYLLDVYTARANNRTLSELTKQDYATLDGEYRRYMSNLTPR